MKRVQHDPPPEIYIANPIERLAMVDSVSSSSRSPRSSRRAFPATPVMKQTQTSFAELPADIYLPNSRFENSSDSKVKSININTARSLSKISAMYMPISDDTSEEGDNAPFEYLPNDYSQPKSTRMLGIGMEYPSTPTNNLSQTSIKPATPEFFGVFKTRKINPFKMKQLGTSRSVEDFKSRRARCQNRGAIVAQRVPDPKDVLGDWDKSTREEINTTKGLELKPWAPLKIAKKPQERPAGDRFAGEPAFKGHQSVTRLEKSIKSEYPCRKLRKSKSNVELLPAIAYNPELAPLVPAIPSKYDSWEVYEIPDCPNSDTAGSHGSIGYSHRYSGNQAPKPPPLKIKTPSPYDGARPAIPPMTRHDGISSPRWSPVGLKYNDPTAMMTTPFRIPTPENSPGLKSTWSEDTSYDDGYSPTSRLQGSISKAKGNITKATGAFMRMGSKDSKDNRNSSASKSSIISASYRQAQWNPSPTNSATNSATSNTPGLETYSSGKSKSSYGSPVTPSGFFRNTTISSQESVHNGFSNAIKPTKEAKKSPVFQILGLNLKSFKNLKKFTMSAEKRAEMEAKQRREELKRMIRIKRRTNCWESDLDDEEDGNHEQYPYPNLKSA